ncbi:MAG: sulfatase [Vicinamibacteria bacterium]|nr:sulfatase [Vicinamibacteria bacterium]
MIPVSRNPERVWDGVSLSTTLGLVLVAAGCASDVTGPGEPLDRKPNLILIQLDDLDFRTYESMPRQRLLLSAQGTTFSNAIVTRPLSCPSRASVLTGLYAHNHGVLTNSPPRGGFEVFRDLGHEMTTVATWLQAEGYRTTLLGKYLNRYPAGDDTYVPPGWDEWHSLMFDRASEYVSYFMNENGQVVPYGMDPESYETDVLAHKTVDFIARHSGADAPPFFIHLNPSAPHSPAVPAPRHSDAFPGVGAPRTPSFNEADTSDKPQWLQAIPPLSSEETDEIDELTRRRYQALLAVEDMTQQILEALVAAGKLDDTYIFFTSDNGVFSGQHRLPGGKNAPYEEAIRVPLVVRGPRVHAGRIDEAVVGNIDLAPTLVELAGGTPSTTVDGRSLAALLRGERPADWRSEILIESAAGGSPYPLPAYAGLRSAAHTYVEYYSGEIELYDLFKDPDQLVNIANTADPALLSRLAARLDALRDCQGLSCR